LTCVSSRAAPVTAIDRKSAISETRVAASSIHNLSVREANL